MNLLQSLREYARSTLHTIYPHTCLGCGSDTLSHNDVICLSCFSTLPATRFFAQPRNPVEQVFTGRLRIQEAGSAFYFTKQSVLQNILHEIKYRGNREAAAFIGRQIALAIQESNRFADVDLLVPVPLSRRREQQRGYNQSALIATGMADILKIPVSEQVVTRRLNTATQTGKNRSHRWQSMQHVFAVHNGGAAQGKHILLIDDIVTTGATLEACGETILSIPGARLSIATAAYTI